MALDKIIDSALLDGGLTATAEALRTKLGEDGTLLWDSVKGFKDFVDAIPPTAKEWHIEKGSITFAEDVDAGRNIPHSLGVEPNFVVVIADEFEHNPDSTNRYCICGALAKHKYKITDPNVTILGGYLSVANSQDSLAQTWREFDSKLTATNFYFPTYNGSYKLKAGVTYHYIVGVVE